MEDLSIITEAISRKLGESISITSVQPVSGGCVNECFRIDSEGYPTFFLKKNCLSFLPFFEAEALALKEIKSSDTVRVPDVICFGKTAQHSFLVLEFMEIGGNSDSIQKNLGRQLAQMHRSSKEYFGWETDNCIGSTPQPNPKTENWVSFYRDFRLLHQFNLAEKKGRVFKNKSDLLEGIDVFFHDYSPHPSLLHGDLWGGNSGSTQAGEPFIFDPASYYGDRETDLAFTYMFGGFSSAFYLGYEKIYPLDKGFHTRKILYNLYHELNHFNLFGGGYANSAESSINQLMKHIH